MSRGLAVLRPEPGNAATAARVEAGGFRAVRLPLFEVRSLDWTVPDPDAFDGLLLTSANAVRHAGPGLMALRELTVIAVGTQTADAARAVGLQVETVGENGVTELLTLADGKNRLLHLAGRDRTPTGPAIAETIPVYVSEPLAISKADLQTLDGSIALLHSARAARRLAELAAGADIAVAVAALSEAVAEAAGSGWRGIAVAAAPNDAALIAAAIALAD